MQGHARVPKACVTLALAGVNYEVPTTRVKIVNNIPTVQDDMKSFETALEQRAYKTRLSRCPCRGLTTSLLVVSRDLHK